MATVVLPRSPLTNHILGQINSVVTVGDADAPEEGGWDGPPDHQTSSYTPYVVLVPATAGDATGPIGSSASDILVPYVVNGYGLSREHVEGYMDMVRQVLVAMSRTIVVLGDSSWKIQQVRCNSIGGVSRNDSIEPSEFSQTDVFTLYMSKEL
jgi:hypothetical protein